MKKITRRQAAGFLRPIRACFAQIKSGEVDSIRGYAVTRMRHDDSYARIDYCIAGFRGMISRLAPDIGLASLERLERLISSGVPVTQRQIDAALTTLRVCEDAFVKLTKEAVSSAVLTEQISIELESAGLKEAA